MVLVGRDRGDLGVRHSDLRVERGEFQMLLVFLWAVVAARERENQRVVALELAESAYCTRVIGQFVVIVQNALQKLEPPGPIPPRHIKSR